MDNSFFKLHKSIEEALSLGLNKSARNIYYNSVQLSPNEAYAQKSNSKENISFEGDYEVHLVDACNNEVLEITNNVFIEEFIDYNGITQINIEIINIGQDFHGQALIMRFSSTSSNDVYYARPMIISDWNLEKTIRLDYWNNKNIDGTSYEESSLKQAIRLKGKWNGYDNNSSSDEYYQISTGNTISTRYLEKLKSNYLCEMMDVFTYHRVLRIFKTNNIYIDGVRITDKPILSESPSINNSSLLNATFSAFRNEDDTYEYEYQIYSGIELTNLIPLGAYTLSSLPSQIIGRFSNELVQLNTGTLTIYDASDDSVVQTFTQDDIFLVFFPNTQFVISDLGSYVTTNGDYYILFDTGLFTDYFGNELDGFINPDQWAFSVVDGEYEENEYNNDEYLT